MSKKNLLKNKINGWVFMDKPSGITSNYVLSKLKKILSPQKIGHAGTLDPLATGILPVALGEATKTVNFIMGKSKAYYFTIKWGEDTDSLDSDGIVTAKSTKRPSKKEIEEVLKQFIPVDIEQMPPAFSALKVNGKRAYDLARQGEKVELKSRQVKFYDVKLESFSESTASFTVKCGKGFYVRSFARDICKKLGVCGHIIELRRTSLGKISEKDVITLDSLAEMVHNASYSSEEWLHSISSVLDDILVHEVTENEARDLKHGKSLYLSQEMLEGVFVVVNQGKEIAICERCDTVIKPLRVFNL